MSYKRILMKDSREAIYLKSKASYFSNVAQEQSRHKVQISSKLIIN